MSVLTCHPERSEGLLRVEWQRLNDCDAQGGVLRIAFPCHAYSLDLYGTALVLEEFGNVIARGGAGVVTASQSRHPFRRSCPSKTKRWHYARRERLFPRSAARVRFVRRLIVIATRSRTGLKHLLPGSTAERVVRYATLSHSRGAPARRKKMAQRKVADF